MPKSTVESMNNSKNKLNSEIILIFNYNPNTHYILGLKSTILRASYPISDVSL